MFHIKPTADKGDVFRFKSNFIKYVQKLREGKESEKFFEALTEGVGSDTGVHETCMNAAEGVRGIIARHTMACKTEVLAYLERVADELNIPLR